MGRGLSELQKHILNKANQLGRVYYADICEGYFNWKPIKPIKRYEETKKDPPKQIGRICYPGSQFFSRQQIGEQEYRKVMASISRSCRRLHDRGLVTWIAGEIAHWSGVELTDRGREYVSVNLLQNSVKS